MAGQRATQTVPGGGDHIPQIVPVGIGFQMARFQPGEVEQVLHQPVQAASGFLQFIGQGLLGGAERSGIVQAAGGGIDGGERGTQFVGDGVEQRLAEAFGLGDQFGLQLRVAQALTIQHQGDLADEGIQQIPLRW